MIRTVAATTPGKNVQILLLRQGRSMEINITVGRRPREEGLTCAFLSWKTTATFPASS